MTSRKQYGVCTIIAKNYISFARTLINSFATHHPDANCYVLIIDNIDGYIDPTKENFEIIDIDALKIKNLSEFCFKYNIIELSTAFKPYLLKHLLDSKSIDKLFYLDPDILVTNHLNNLYQQLNKNDILFTPHIDEDYPNDGFLPNDSIIMRHGILNLGFIGLKKSKNVNNFLLWWQQKLYDKCFIDYKKGYFVDQKFIDIALTLFANYKIINNTGYNTAYWNLHNRSISYIQNRWLCNNNPLYFFHFSSYKPENKNIISSHQTRFNFEGNDVLFLLYSQYHELLLTNDYLNTYKWPYSFNYFSNGKIINNLIRKFYRSHLLKIKMENPFNIHSYNIGVRILFLIFRLYGVFYNFMSTFIYKVLKFITF